MAIFRGIGGAGDSTTDATITAVTQQATNAAASASAAETAKDLAEDAQEAAETAQGLAEAAQGAAETAATNAENSEDAAADSSADAAKLAVTVEDTQYTLSDGVTTGYSALHYAAKAEDSATAAYTSETNAFTSEGNASTSETNAATSETNAANSSSDASKLAVTAEDTQYTLSDGTTTGYSSLHYAAKAASSASAASTSESNAASSASAASAAQTAAETAQVAAEAAQEAIDGLYLGAQASDPTLDNNGDPVTAGDWYYNTATAVTRIYDGSAWVNGAVSTAAFLLSGNNLSDLDNAATARTNLGLGTAATTASTDYATAAQGTLADSATQPGDNISTLTNDSGYLTSFTETNDLTAAVTWANVPDANITQSSVTQHQAALSITESQISDLGTYLTDITGESIKDLSDVYSTMSPTDGQLLTWDNANTRWDAQDAPVSLPDQSGHAGEYLTTDGTTASWAALDTDANSTTKGLYEHANTISANYTITSGNNAMSAGVMTINSGVTVTVPSGSRWVVV